MPHDIAALRSKKSITGEISIIIVTAYPFRGDYSDDNPAVVRVIKLGSSMME
ncbi:MAG: hypothetical protein ACWGQW_23345 [bacterium]